MNKLTNLIHNRSGLAYPNIMKLVLNGKIGILTCPHKGSPFGQVNYTTILACQQDITLLEYLRNWTQNRLKVNNLVSGAIGTSGNKTDDC